MLPSGIAKSATKNNNDHESLCGSAGGRVKMPATETGLHHACTTCALSLGDGKVHLHRSKNGNGCRQNHDAPDDLSEAKLMRSKLESSRP